MDRDQDFLLTPDRPFALLIHHMNPTQVHRVQETMQRPFPANLRTAPLEPFLRPPQAATTRFQAFHRQLLQYSTLTTLTIEATTPTVTMLLTNTNINCRRLILLAHWVFHLPHYLESQVESICQVLLMKDLNVRTIPKPRANIN